MRVKDLEEAGTDGCGSGGGSSGGGSGVGRSGVGGFSSGEGADGPVAGIRGGGDHGGAVVGGSRKLGLGGAIHVVVVLVRGVGLRHGLVEGGNVVGDLAAGQSGLGGDVEGAHAPRKEAHALRDPRAEPGRCPERVGVVPVVEAILRVHGGVGHSQGGDGGRRGGDGGGKTGFENGKRHHE